MMYRVGWVQNQVVESEAGTTILYAIDHPPQQRRVYEIADIRKMNR